MTFSTRLKRLSLVLSLALGLVVFGCTKENQKKGDSAETKGSVKVDVAKADKADHDHSEWWCAPHGIPEEICGLCNKKYRDEKKAEGDWCEDHKRLKSQCFKCDPTLYERIFEPMYVAQYGKKPERPPESQFKK